MNKTKGWKKDGPQTRSNWTDPSLKFLDWVNAFEFEKTLLGKIGYFLETRFQVRRISLLFLGCLALSYLVFFSFDIPYHVQVGSVSQTTIKSPISMDVTDDIATESKRLQAEMSVPPVFDFDPDVFESISNRIYRSFLAVRAHREEVMNRFKNRSRDELSKEYLRYKEEFEKNLDAEVPQRIFEWLAEKQFAIELENLIIRALERWSSEQRIAESPHKYINPDQEKVIVKLIHRGRPTEEYTIPSTVILDLNNRDQFALESIPGLHKLNERDRLLLKQFSYSLLRPNLTFNKTETDARRAKARESVLPVTISVKKNQVLISEGTIVEPLQASILEKIKAQTSNQRKDFLALNLSLLLLITVLTFLSYTRRFTINQVRVLPRDVVAMGTVAFLVVFICKLFWFITDVLVTARFGSLLPEGIFLYAAPVAAGSMIVGLLINYGEIVWLFTLFLATVLSFLVDLPYHLLIYTSVSGIMAARGVFKCSKRNDIYMAGLKTGLVNSAIVTLLIFATQSVEKSILPQIHWFMIAGFLSAVLSSLITLAIIPFFEALFGYTTDVKLMELSNLNHPLLQEMIVRAPGTYHHSLVVGSMVEAAAEKIGANPLLAKVMAYYHDIGKTNHAGYFIENQKPGRNPHDHISPFMSKTVLISHIKDGVDLGIKHKLGKPIIDGIVQHHGTTLIAYFYNKTQENADGDIDQVPEDEFRYPGPKPQFKEAALIMLGDSIEAAARSLDEPTTMRLQNIVKNIIQRKFMEGQLEECNLTLKDLSTIEASFTRTLIGIHHQRIDYPRQAGGGASLPPEKGGLRQSVKKSPPPS